MNVIEVPESLLYIVTDAVLRTLLRIIPNYSEASKIGDI